MSAEFIRVFGRLRPSAKGPKANPILSADHGGVLRVDDEETARSFMFDGVFDQQATQDDVFKMSCRRIVEGCFEGINGCIFAYGQTGSGKTHTMLGPSHVEDFFMDRVYKGLIPRAADLLFDTLNSKQAQLADKFTFTVQCMFLELYNENIYDLLSPVNTVTLRHVGDNVIINGAEVETVNSLVDMMRLVQQGWDGRRTAETAMNRESSRSHALLIVDITMEEIENGISNKRTARLNLVDLAGSERQKNTNAVGARLKEATNINNSLSVLGRVIRTLSTSPLSHVAYRDSKLTHLLKDSLGGNSRTAVIVNLHPDKLYLSESLSTLRFAQACKKVKNHAQANREVTGDSVLALKAEIERQRTRADNIEATVRQEIGAELAATIARLEAAVTEKEEWRQRTQEKEKDLAQLRLKLQFRSLQTQIPADQLDREDLLLRDVNVVLASRVDGTASMQEMDVVGLTGLVEQLRSDFADCEERANQLALELETTREKYSEALNNTICSSPMRNLTNTMAGTSMTPRQKKLRRRTQCFQEENVRRKSSVARGPMLFPEEDEEGVTVPATADDGFQEEKIVELEKNCNQLSQAVRERDTSIADFRALLESKSEEHQLELHELRASRDEAADQLTAVHQRLSAAEDKLAQYELDLSQVSRDLGLSQRQLSETQSALDTANSQLLDLENELERTRDELASSAALHEAQLAERTAELRNEYGMVLATKEQLIDARHSNWQVEREALESQLSDTQRKANEQQKLLMEYTISLKDSAAELADLRSERDDLKEDVMLLQQSVSNREEELTDLRAAYEEKKAEEQERHKSEVFVLKRRLAVEKENHTKTKADLLTQMEMNESRTTELGSQLQELTIEIEELRERRRQDKELNQDRICDVTNQRDELQKRTEEMRQTFGLLKRDVTTKEEENGRLLKAVADQENVNKSLQSDQVRLVKEMSSLKAEKLELEQELKLVQTSRDKMCKDMAVLSSEYEKQAAELNELCGHANNKQKIKMLEKTRQETMSLKKENEQLKAQLARAPQSTSEAGSAPRRVTRSRKASTSNS